MIQYESPVIIKERRYTVTLRQGRDGVWNASGDFHGLKIEVKGYSAGTALTLWTATASSHRL